MIRRLHTRCITAYLGQLLLGFVMKRRNVAKGFLGSTVKQIACLSIASSVLMSPLAAYAETAPIEAAADAKMAPVSTVSESEVLNILVPAQATSVDPEQIAPPKAVYTDISGKPAAQEKDAKNDAPKSGGRMAKLRKMASRMRYSREKKAIASADLGADSQNKSESKPEEKNTATSPVSESGSESTETKTETTSTEVAPTAAQAETGAAESASLPADAASANSDASTAAPVADATEVIDESRDKDGAAIAFGLPGTLNDLENASKLSPDGIIVVDNDEAVEQNDHLQYEEMPLDEGKTKVKIGARFPVVITSALNSKTNKKGDRLEARLKYDLKIGDKLIAKKGSVVRGHINYCLKARTILHSLWSPERWYRNSGCIGIDFDEIINEKGEHIPCAAAPAQAGRVIKNKGEGRELGVNHNGQVVGPWAQQLRYKAVRVGLNFAMAPAGVFSFGAMPVALGVIGAANPNFAFGRPVGLNVRHRRIKGFLWGALSGVPGSWLIEDTTVKGQEAIIRPGDEFYAAFKQEFNGEPETDASIMAGASAKVRGQVIKEPAAKKK